ncbi:MAG: DinB family protein [Filimonas sp.]|nr:DinB family protein [Filimonas sp.]
MASVTILLTRFNETADVLLNALARYSLTTLQQQLQPGAWSLGQMYTHILDDTEYYIEQMKAALATAENTTETMHTDAKAMFANNAFPDIQIAGPTTGIYIPQPESKELLVQRLSSIKATINTLYQSFDDTKPQGKTLHPGLLFFSSLEWLQFAEMHMRHHFRQKERIERALKL